MALEVSWNKTCLITVFLNKTQTVSWEVTWSSTDLKFIQVNCICQYSPSKRKGQQKPWFSTLQIVKKLFLKTCYWHHWLPRKIRNWQIDSVLHIFSYGILYNIKWCFICMHRRHQMKQILSIFLLLILSVPSSKQFEVSLPLALSSPLSFYILD